MSKGVVAVVLVGAVTGCRSPFLGQRQSANQVEASPEAASGQPNRQTRVQRANQPTRQAGNTNQRTAQAPANAQAPDATVNPEASGTATADQQTSDPGEGVPALW
jgi:hypothetical protein